METYTAHAENSGQRSLAVPRPRRRLAPPPPAPADPAPWQQLLGEPALSPAELDLLMHLAERRHVPSGDTVLAPDEPARHLVLLLSGDVVLGSRAADGGLRTERSVTGPAWLDLSAAWLGEPYAMTAQALSDVSIAVLPLTRLQAEFAHHPGLLQRLCISLARRVHELTLASRNLAHNDAPARFAQWLLQRCPAGEKACEITLHERKRDIAQQLAMTPETLSRLMRSFETRGLVSVRGYVVAVHDLALLRSVAGAAMG